MDMVSGDMVAKDADTFWAPQKCPKTFEYMLRVAGACDPTCGGVSVQTRHVCCRKMGQINFKPVLCNDTYPASDPADYYHLAWLSYTGDVLPSGRMSPHHLLVPK